MNLTRYQPFADMMASPFFFDFGPWMAGEYFGARAVYPRVDFFEDGNKMVLKADLPDMDREDLSVQVDNGTLTLKGERKVENNGTRNNFRFMERRSGSFVRHFELPAGINADKIEAHYAKGVLTVEIPQEEAVKPKYIKVS